MVDQVQGLMVGNMSVQYLKVKTRIENHSKMKELMALNKHMLALQLGQNTLSDCGPHVGLLCDIACCQYQLGFVTSCSEMLNLISAEFKSAYQLLSYESCRRTLVFVSKIQEELGHVFESLESLTKAYQYCESKKDFKMILTQELRLLSYLGLKDKILDRMSLLNQDSLYTYSDKIEILHALLWLEYCLFGFDSAQKIFFKLINESLSESDLRLVYRDFLEIVCHARVGSTELYLTEIQKFKERNNLQSFDLFLLDYLTHLDNLSDYSFNDDLSLMQKLRILILKSKGSRENNSTGSKNHVQYALLTQHLSLSSQKLLKNLLPEINMNTCEPVEVDLAEFTELQKKILVLFETTDSLSLNELSKKLWNEEYTVVHYDRLRMLVYKLNKLMLSKTAYSIFSINKNSIKLNQRIKIAS